MGKNKGKARATEAQIAQQIAAAQFPSTGFHLVAVEVELPLAAQFHDDLEKGCREVLEGWVGRYIPSLEVTLCSISWPLQLPKPAAHFIGNGATVLATVRFEGIGWRPVVGSRLVGKINTSSSAHVGLLLHNTFNATIEHFSIPADRYTYDEEKLAPFKVQEKSRHLAEGEEPEYDEYDYGCWVDKITGEPLGGEEGKLDFVVVGLTIATGLVTTLGSLLDDPLNPPPRIEANDGVDGAEAAEAIRAPSPKTVRFKADTQSPPARKAKKKKRKATQADEAVDASVDTVIEAEGDQSAVKEAVQAPADPEQQRPKKKRKQ